jgi:hypothetical protein
VSPRCTAPRLEAALDAIAPSLLCPERHRCPLARPDCVIFAPGWYCEDRDLVVLPTLLLDPDYEPEPDDEANGDDEPDDDYC